MRETQIVEGIRQLAAFGTRNASILRGIGDDCAILRPRANEDLVFTSDFVLEGRHFTLDTHTAPEVGHKALARSLSDLAAMGAERRLRDRARLAFGRGVVRGGGAQDRLLLPSRGQQWGDRSHRTAGVDRRR